MHHARKDGVFSDRALARAAFSILSPDDKLKHHSMSWLKELSNNLRRIPLRVNMKNPSSTTTSFSNRFAPSLSWTLIVLGVLALIVVGRFWMKQRTQEFLTTTSPDHTYTVRLKGNKGRPLIMPNEVRADVSKAGQLFVSDIWLHRAEDSFDLSFEAGFPDVRWLTDNIVEFYRPEYFDQGTDSLTVENNAGKLIKHLRVQSENKFLIFELRSGESISLKIPAARGDSQWIAVAGAFADGLEIPFKSESFDKRHHSNYHIAVALSDTTIDAH